MHSIARQKLTGETVHVCYYAFASLQWSFVCSFVRQTCEQGHLKTNDPTLLQIGISSPRGNDYETIKFGVQEVVKDQGHRTCLRAPSSGH